MSNFPLGFTRFLWYNRKNGKRNEKPMLEKYKLMLVDDEPWALSGLAEIIDWEAEGFTVVARCECGADALRSAPQVRPDAVITDIRMPDMSGIQLIRRLQSIFPVQCVVVSAYSDFEVAREALRLSAVHYILKPLVEEEVREAAALLRQKLDTTEHFNPEPPPPLQVDPKTPEFQTPWGGVNSCYLLLSESRIYLMPSADQTEHRQFIQIGELYGVLTDRIPSPLPPDIGVSICAQDFSDADYLIQTASASLDGGFLFAPSTPLGKNQLSAADIQLYLVEHMGEDITLKDLASHFYLTETYLCDLFKKQTGDTILGFLRRIRIHRAKRLLEKSHITLREVAYQCGYSDYSYFGRHFKAEVGITPDLYRKEKRYS